MMHNSGGAKERARVALAAFRAGETVTISNSPGVDGSLFEHEGPFSLEERGGSVALCGENGREYLFDESTLVFHP